VLQLFIFLLELVDVRCVDALAHHKLMCKLVETDLLLRVEVETLVAITILGRVHHRLSLDVMLQPCALLLEFVVIILQNLDQLLEVLDFLLVVYSDGVQIKAVVVGDLRHLSKALVFGGQVVNGVGGRVKLMQEISYTSTLSIL
jgi:hypothetical protein